MLSDQHPKYTLLPGDMVRGRWNGRAYQVIRRLGNGANGDVYLVRGKHRNYALKMAPDAHGIALEYRLLKQLQKAAMQTDSQVRGCRLGPFAYELDDFVSAKQTTSFFYTMEYIAGVPVGSYFSNNGNSQCASPSAQLQSAVTQLLQFLQRLHALGYAFGDLKAENVIISPATGYIRLVDFGGVTRFGEGIRQYTEWNDRAYWGAGSRKADAAYDLFAVAMLIVQLLGVHPAQSDYRQVKQLLPSLQAIYGTSAWISVLDKAWHGGYINAEHMRQDVAAIHQRTPQTSTGRNQLLSKMNEGMLREWDWSDWTLVSSAVACLFLVLRLLMVQ